MKIRRAKPFPFTEVVTKLKEKTEGLGALVDKEKKKKVPPTTTFLRRGTQAECAELAGRSPLIPTLIS